MELLALVRAADAIGASEDVKGSILGMVEAPAQGDRALNGAFTTEEVTALGRGVGAR